MGTRTLVCLNHYDRKSPESTFDKRFCEGHLKIPTYKFLNIFPSEETKFLNGNKPLHLTENFKSHNRPYQYRYFGPNIFLSF